jgi:hypothetical protein
MKERGWLDPADSALADAVSKALFYSGVWTGESTGAFTGTGGALSVCEFRITRSILRFIALPSGVAFDATG